MIWRNFQAERSHPKRGAVLVQAAVSSLVLLGFASFVIDYGILWVSRNQAQNAADAGATAGALARAYDGDSTPSVGGPAWTSASVVAQANLVWNAPGTTVVGFTLSELGELGLRFGQCLSQRREREPDAPHPVCTAFGNHLTRRAGDGVRTGGHRERH